MYTLLLAASEALPREPLSSQAMFGIAIGIAAGVILITLFSE